MLSYQEDRFWISLLASESIDAMIKVGWTGIVCKVDMKKAYDHVNWGFLVWVLERMGFRSSGGIGSRFVLLPSLC